MRLGLVLALFIPLFFYAVLPGCEFESEAVDATGLSQVDLRIEGMT